jgi:hypothetical protein
MLDTFFGLPVHPLIVHATVVVVPTAALAVVLAVFWRRFREWAGAAPMALSALAVVLTPLSTSSGESLEQRLSDTSLIEDHAQLGDLLIWWVVPLAVVSAGSWWLHRRRVGRGLVTGALAALSVIVASGTLVTVALIGHSGAKAAWEARMTHSSGVASRAGSDG